MPVCYVMKSQMDLVVPLSLGGKHKKEHMGWFFAYVSHKAFETSLIMLLTSDPYIPYWVHITNVTYISLIFWYIAN